MSDLKMPGLSSVVLDGRLGHTPKMRKLATSGTDVCELRLAHQIGFGEKEKTLWIDVTCFGKVAERCGKLAKGAAVLVAGRLDLQQWTGKDKEQHEKIAIVANDVRPLEWPAKAGAGKGREDSEDEEPWNQ